MDWQGIMISRFGKNWVTKEYASVDVFRFAEDYSKIEYELQATKDKLNIAIEALEFYANKKSWSLQNQNGSYIIINKNDRYFDSSNKSFWNNRYGGKLAIRVIQQIKKDL